MLRLAVGMKVYEIKTQLVNVLMPLPTLTEQTIATALTDVDELISGLEKLISKKKTSNKNRSN